MKKLSERYLIEYKPIKAIWLFSIPLIIGNFFQQTYTMVDSMVVGRYVSDDAMLYLNIYFCGLPFLFMYNIISSMFNAVGKSKIPLYSPMEEP